MSVMRTIEISDERWHQLARLASATGRSRTQLIRDIFYTVVKCAVDDNPMTLASAPYKTANCGLTDAMVNIGVENFQPTKIDPETWCIVPGATQGFYPASFTRKEATERAERLQAMIGKVRDPQAGSGEQAGVPARGVPGKKKFKLKPLVFDGGKTFE